MSRKRKPRRPVRRRPQTPFWHGGIPGLAVGDHITPPSSRGPLPASYQVGCYPASPDHVYVTQDRDYARYFAALNTPPGTLYRVTPIGDLEPDDDSPTQRKSFACRAAIIVSIDEPAVTDSVALQLYGNRYNTWQDGRLMYDNVGQMLPSPEMEALGITAEHLKPCGFLPSPQAASAYLYALGYRPT